jgi:hypothetical protein
VLQKMDVLIAGDYEEGRGVSRIPESRLSQPGNHLSHALMVAALTLLICGILFTIGEFNDPFSGVVEIRPDAFREVLGSFGET